MTEDFDTARDLFTAGGRVEGEIFAPILLESKCGDFIWFSFEINAFHPEPLLHSMTSFSASDVRRRSQYYPYIPADYMYFRSVFGEASRKNYVPRILGIQFEVANPGSTVLSHREILLTQMETQLIHLIPV